MGKKRELTWKHFDFKPPPQEASHEQLMEFVGMLSFLMTASQRHGWAWTVAKRAARSYFEKWHPDLELPK